ncbi:hypothetical protein ACF1BQ_029760 [Bradyrhizobium sp. RDT10]
MKDWRVRVWGMHERANIQLSRVDRSKLEAVAANGDSPQKHVWRATIVLVMADGRGTAEITQAQGQDADLALAGTFSLRRSRRPLAGQDPAVAYSAAEP